MYDFWEHESSNILTLQGLFLSGFPTHAWAVCNNTQLILTSWAKDKFVLTVFPAVFLQFVCMDNNFARCTVTNDVSRHNDDISLNNLDSSDYSSSNQNNVAFVEEFFS